MDTHTCVRMRVSLSLRLSVCVCGLCLCEADKKNEDKKKTRGEIEDTFPVFKAGTSKAAPARASSAWSHRLTP